MKKAAFTIASKNYLPYAVALYQSFLDFNPDYEFYIFIMDLLKDEEDIYLIRRLSQFININNVNFSLGVKFQLADFPLENMAWKYSILEMNTAIKPFIIEYLFCNNYDRVIYLDPDILFYHEISILEEKFEKYEIILTPHITQPYNDQNNPSDLDILRAGTYNLGFIVLNKTSNTLNIIKWWQKKLKDLCFVDISQGIFVDQKWCEFFPSFAKAYILKYPGCNCAYWNLHEKKFVKHKGKWFTNDTPLIFFHFSGLPLNNIHLISKHQNRYNFKNYPVIKKLFVEYKNKILDIKRKLRISEKIKYYYDYLPFTNIKLSSEIRKNIPFYNKIYSNSSEDILFFLKNILQDRFGDNRINYCAYSIWKSCSDLQNAFPDLEKNIYSREQFKNWWEHWGIHQYNFPELFKEIYSSDEKILNWYITFLQEDIFGDGLISRFFLYVWWLKEQKNDISTKEIFNLTIKNLIRQNLINKYHIIKTVYPKIPNLKQMRYSSLISYLSRDVFGDQTVNIFSYLLYKQRVDLQKNFPQLSHSLESRENYYKWFQEFVDKEKLPPDLLKIDSKFLYEEFQNFQKFLDQDIFLDSLVSGKTFLLWLLNKNLQSKYPDLSNYSYRKQFFLVFNYNLSHKNSKKVSFKVEPSFNLIGYFKNILGISEVAKSVIYSLAKTGLPFSTFDVSLDILDKREQESFLNNYSAILSLSPFNIFFVNADQVPHVYNRYSFLFQDKLNLSVWWWEFEDGFQIFEKSFNYVDVVLTFTEFVFNAIRKIDTNKVKKVPFPYMMPSKFGLQDQLKIGNYYFNKNDEFYYFLFIFDFNSSYQRKNPEAILEAFSLTFKKAPQLQKKIKLIFKCSNSHNAKKIFKKFKEKIFSLGLENNVIIINQALSRRYLLSLINISDCYISLHCSEGLGLGLLEAMALGKPTISTAYGGNMEFMSSSNSLLVDYSLKKFSSDVDVYRLVKKAADPDIEQASSYIIKIVNHPAVAQKLGKIASSSIRSWSQKNYLLFQKYVLDFLQENLSKA